MNYCLLRAKGMSISIADQQAIILDYAKANSIKIDKIITDTSSATLELEDRSEFFLVLKSLSTQDSILVFNTQTLSIKACELAKIFECAFKKGVLFHLCSQEIVLDANSDLIFILELLGSHKEPTKQALAHGRPKGSFSFSKFDTINEDIVKKLDQKKSVAQIAKELNVSRTSLKDYINSRNLKIISQIEKKGDIIFNTKQKSKKTCTLKGS